MRRSRRSPFHYHGAGLYGLLGHQISDVLPRSSLAQDQMQQSIPEELGRVGALGLFVEYKAPAQVGSLIR